MSPRAGVSTRLVALLGDPVGHSLSPVFQNAAFRAAGVDGVYLPLRCDGDGLPGLLRGIALAGGAGNVTLPHKERAARVVDRTTSVVRRTGACNTFWYENGEVWGDNTDVHGFARAVHGLLGASPAGARVLLLGAGGAARAALCALTDAEAAEVVILNRDVHRAERLAAELPGRRTRVVAAHSVRGLRGESFTLAVNATSLGLRADDPLPLSPEHGLRLETALDLVYAPGETRWVRESRARGIRAADGVEMLLHQGAAAFERWWKRDAPLEAMRMSLAGDAR